jgi:TrmH RNA methyltransferase
VRGRDARFYGLHACRALWARRPDDVRRVFVSEALVGELGDVLKALARSRRPYRVVDDEELSRVAGTRHHEGVCFVAAPLPAGDTDAILRTLDADDAPARLLFLDSVDNPHNVGAILRSAAHFGTLAVAGLDDELPEPQGALARVAQGGAEHVPLLRWGRPRKGLRALGQRGVARVATVVEGGEDLYEADLPPRCVFLLGSEATGLGPSARAIADVEVTIGGTGAVESLNVAVAAALLLAEHRRRHG